MIKEESRTKLSNSSVFIIIPAYNEELVLEKTLTPLVDAGYSIVLVDDASTDSTSAVASKFLLHYIRHLFNLGQGAALQTGMSYALKQGAEILVHFDADGQHQMSDISKMIAPIIEKKCLVTLGSRFLCREDARMIPLAKRILLKGARLLNGLLTGLWLTDAHNGFRALSKEAANKIYLQENGFSHASEILMQIKQYGLSYIEIPTSIRYTSYSMAKGQSVWNALNIFIDLLLRRLFK